MNEKDSMFHWKLMSLPLRRAPETLLKRLLSDLSGTRENPPMIQNDMFKVNILSVPAGSRNFLMRHPVMSLAAGIAAVSVLVLVPIIPGGSADSSFAGRPSLELPAASGSSRSVVLQSLTLPVGEERIGIAQALGRVMGLGSKPASFVPPPQRNQFDTSVPMDLAALKARGMKQFNQMASSRFHGAGSRTAAGAANSQPNAMSAPAAALSASRVPSGQGLSSAAGVRRGVGGRAFIATGGAPAPSGPSGGGMATHAYGAADEVRGGGAMAAGAPIGDAGVAPGAAVASGGVGIQTGALDSRPAPNATRSGSSGPVAQSNGGSSGGAPARVLSTIKDKPALDAASDITFSPSAAKWDNKTAPLTVTVSGLSSAQNTRICVAILISPDLPADPYNCINQDGSINESGFQDFDLAHGNAYLQAAWQYKNGRWVGTFPPNSPNLGPGTAIREYFWDTSTDKIGSGSLEITKPRARSFLNLQ